jgi:hypothetical protein
MGIIINTPEYNSKFFDNEDDLLNKEYLVKREDDDYSRGDSHSSSSDSSRGSDNYDSDNDRSRSNRSSSDGDERSSSSSNHSSSDNGYSNSNDYSSSYYSNNNDYNNDSRSGRKSEDLQRAPVSQTDFIGFEGEEKPLDQLQQKEESKNNTLISNKYIKFGSIGVVGVIALFILVRFIVKHRKKNDLSKNFSKNYSKARDIIQHPDADNTSFDSRTSTSLYRMESADSIVNMFHTTDVTYERANSNRNITPIITNNISSKMSKVSPITFANLMNNQQPSSPVDGDITLDSPHSLQNIHLPSSTGSTISLSSEESKSTLARSKGATQQSNQKFKPHRRSKFVSSRSKSLVNTNYYMPPDFCMTPRITKKIPGLDESPVPTDDELEYPPTPLPDSLDDIPFSDNPDIDSEDTDAASSIIEPLDEIPQEHEIQQELELQQEIREEEVKAQEIREQEIRAKTIRERAIREQAIKEQEIREQKIRAKDLKPLEIKTKEVANKKSKQKSKNRLSQSSIQRQPSPLQKESSQIIEDRQYYKNSPLKQEFSPESVIPVSYPAKKNIYNPVISPSPNHQQSDVQTNILHNKVYTSSINNTSSPVPSQVSRYSIAKENTQITQSPLQRQPPPLKIQSSKSKITVEDLQLSPSKQKGSVHQRQSSHLSQSSKSKVVSHHHHHHRQPSQPSPSSSSKSKGIREHRLSQSSVKKVSHRRESSQLSQSSITMVDYEPEPSSLSQSTITMVDYEEDITQNSSYQPMKSVDPVIKQSKPSSGKVKTLKNKIKNKNKKESKQVKPPPPKPNPRKSSRADNSAFEDLNSSKVNVFNTNLELSKTSEMSFEEEMMTSFDQYSNNITDNFNIYNGNSSHMLHNNQII